MTDEAPVSLKSYTEPQKGSQLTKLMGSASQSRMAKHLTEAHVDVTHVLTATRGYRAIGD